MGQARIMLFPFFFMVCTISCLSLVKPLCMVCILKRRAKPPDGGDLHLIKHQWQLAVEFKEKRACLLQFRPHKL